VIAVEPYRPNIELLRRNVALNNATNVTTLHAAVSDREGTGTLLVSRRSNWHSLSRHKRVTEGNSVSVPLKTIQTICGDVGRTINLIRMDIEGHELEALQGAERVIRSDSPSLVVEVHADILRVEKTRMLLKWLSNLGYRLQFVVRRSDDEARGRKGALAWIPTGPFRANKEGGWGAGNLGD
jgi:FkbM family methyltransferase